MVMLRQSKCSGGAHDLLIRAHAKAFPLKTDGVTAHVAL